MKKLCVSLFAIVFFSCLSADKKNLKPTIELNPKVSVKISRTYISGKAPVKNSSEEIRLMMETLVDSVLKKDLSVLLNFIFREKGIYLDLKGLWTYEELIQEMSLKDSYFTIFFFDTEKLKTHKKSDDVHTVRDLLILSGGLDLDLFFESPHSCEIKIRFVSGNKLERDLNNPYFIQEGGKWYIYRLF
ncbi:MAG: hypothetical protein IT569_06150 [Leptospiraceae bacterium]|nr:hypothetical protein [Leptospiraceae bacterium]